MTFRLTLEHGAAVTLIVAYLVAVHISRPSVRRHPGDAMPSLRGLAVFASVLLFWAAFFLGRYSR